MQVYLRVQICDKEHGLLIPYNSEANAQLAQMRRAAQSGIYDCHTDLVLQPRSMQPTWARWEYVPATPGPTPPRVKSGGDDSQDDGNKNDRPPKEELRGETPFTPLPRGAEHQFFVDDIVMEGPPMPDDRFGVDRRLPLYSVPDEILAAMPPDAAQALMQAQKDEQAKRQCWPDVDDKATYVPLAINYLIPDLP